MRIKMTGIYVKEVDKAHLFYTTVLNFTEVMYTPEANLAIVASPEEPSGTTLLLEPIDTSLAADYQKALYKARIPVIVFSVDNITEEYERLKKLKVEFLMGPVPQDFGFQTIFDDTCGNLIALVELNSQK